MTGTLDERVTFVVDPDLIKERERKTLLEKGEEIAHIIKQGGYEVKLNHPIDNCLFIKILQQPPRGFLWLRWSFPLCVGDLYLNGWKYEDDINKKWTFHIYGREEFPKLRVLAEEFARRYDTINIELSLKMDEPYYYDDGSGL